eukprot:jgi/Psemu1/28571/gm1.28571_g
MGILLGLGLLLQLLKFFGLVIYQRENSNNNSSNNNNNPTPVSTTTGKRKKKRARRPLPLSASRPPVASLAPVARPSGAAAILVDPSAVAPAAPSLVPDRPVPLVVGPAAPSLVPDLAIDPSSVAPVAPSIPDPVAPEQDNSNDDSSTTLFDSDSDATTIQDHSRDLGIAVEQLHLPPAVTFS